MDEHGLRLQSSQIVIRNLLRSVDSLPGPYLIGGMVSLFSKRAQRLGDIAPTDCGLESTYSRARFKPAPER